MSHTISAQKADGFHVEVRDWNGRVFHQSKHHSRSDAQRAAEIAERMVTLQGSQSLALECGCDKWTCITCSNDRLGYIAPNTLSDDELLRELGE